ncbi:hypothetical protein [Ligilactobacillus ruminis]|uniref:hypothetical protein n=1 Tax=Ligilactobacillus ruminis TaxID=1623 RepID=UPI0009B99ADE|nr:hypothetical protein [Ligilactobacillus ruminis]
MGQRGLFADTELKSVEKPEKSGKKDKKIISTYIYIIYHHYRFFSFSKNFFTVVFPGMEYRHKVAMGNNRKRLGSQGARRLAADTPLGQPLTP